jgi:hypothetical protein
MTDLVDVYAALREEVEKHRALGHQVWFHNRGLKDLHIQCRTCLGGMNWPEEEYK